MRAQTPSGVLPPWRPRSSWLLKVALMDSMTWRSDLKNQCSSRVFHLRGLGGAFDPCGVEAGFELAAVKGLVGDHDLGVLTCRGQRRCGLQDGVQDDALVGLRAAQRPAYREALQGADQVQAQSPEESGVRGAVAVLGPPGQVRALHGLAGSGAFDRGGVDGTSHRWWALWWSAGAGRGGS